MYVYYIYWRTVREETIIVTILYPALVVVDVRWGAQVGSGGGVWLTADPVTQRLSEFIFDDCLLIFWFASYLIPGRVRLRNPLPSPKARFWAFMSFRLSRSVADVKGRQPELLLIQYLDINNSSVSGPLDPSTRSLILISTRPKLVALLDQKIIGPKEYRSGEK